MDFKEKYTTVELIAADKDGIENQKQIISQDTYVQGEMIQALIYEIGRHK